MATQLPNNPYTQPRQPLSNRPLEDDADNGRAALDNVANTYEKNKTLINGVLIAVVLVIGGWFAWHYMATNNEEKASAKAFYAQQYFMSDSSEKALQGDAGHPGLIRIIKDYGSTKTGNICKYEAGVCYMKMGNTKAAIKQLEDFDGKGTMVGVAAKGLLGAAYMESNDVKKAISAYQDATSDKDNVAQTPMYLMQLGTAYELNKQPEEAKKAYLRIRDEYPQSAQARDIDRYLARLGVIND